MRFPDFLIIGAMKAGTTSLFFDLGRQPAVFFPTDKEPGDLADDAVLTEGGRRRYADRFAAARPVQRCGDASTIYTKLPDVPGVAHRALAVCGALRLVYLVREPVSRAVSHHHHLVARREAPMRFEDALASAPELVHYGCYARQIEPWLDVFGPSSTRVVLFEDYIADPVSALAGICHHLGLGAPVTSTRDAGARNVSRTTRPVIGRWARLRDNPGYRRLLRPVLRPELRARIRQTVLPTPPGAPLPPNPATVEALLERFGPDAERLQHLAGRSEPLWDFDAVRSKLAASRGASS